MAEVLVSSELTNTNTTAQEKEQAIDSMSEEQLQEEELVQGQSKISQYDPLLQKAYELLAPVNKHTLIRILEYCNIPKDCKITPIDNIATWSRVSESGAKLWMAVSKGNLRLGQDTWMQVTGQLASNNRIFKDYGTYAQHILIVFDCVVPIQLLRTLHFNTKKVQPIIHSLYGYEPYNILDISKEEYQKEKLLADVKAIEYGEKYKEHIDFLVHKSPYQAANCILALQGRINLKIQSTLQEVLVRGNTLTMDSVVMHSFEPMAEATRELVARYNVESATEEDRLKVKRFLALYLARIEEVNTKSNAYVDSLRTKYHLDTEETA